MLIGAQRLRVILDDGLCNRVLLTGFLFYLFLTNYNNNAR